MILSLGCFINVEFDFGVEVCFFLAKYSKGDPCCVLKYVSLD
jgi:hypothetical protein